MRLSIIVVNFNVRYFLHICLESLRAATAGIESEIIVVDNASLDGSVSMIRDHFPEVKLISNSENAGFGRACNQALGFAQGQYVLFVNPDTLLGDSLILNALDAFIEDEEIGAVGVCLLDGNGQVLRESKRSIPSLWSAFTKFSGLSDVFKSSSFFNGYYAPGLGYDETGDIEVLPGAFMLIRKDILDELNGFDPRFFMYAEDIDLSYRITKAGYKIRYLGSLHVIHFKGESTQKALTSYTSTFFHSMQLFIRKYRGELYAPAVAWLLELIVLSIQWFETIKKRLLHGSKKQKSHVFPEDIFVLTKESHIKKDLVGYLGQNHFSIVPDHGTGDSSIYLRYIPSYLLNHPETALMLDFRSMSMDQIVDLWKMGSEQPFYIADVQNSFIICSHNKEKQGEVHTFATVLSKVESVTDHQIP